MPRREAWTSDPSAAVQRRAAAPSAGASPAARAPPPILQNYKPVTAERLKTPSDGDWLMVRRTYDGWGYSPLDQITPANVTRLQPVWSFATGVTNGHEAPPIVNNGVMFVSTPGNQVIAIDAKTGALLWRYSRPLPEDVVLLHATSRGVALYGDKVFFAAGEAVLVALDAKTGEEVWTAKVAENKNGYYMSVAPLVADGKVMVGASGGEMGIRGFVAAFDAETGKEAVADLHGACARRARQRDVAERRPVEDRRRVGLGHRHLRSGDQPRVLGHRQRRSLDGRPASRRQSLHLVDDRHRCRDRQDQGPLSVPPERFVGLGRSLAADPRRLHAQRQDGERPDRRRARRLPLVPRAHRRRDQVRRGQAVREAERLQEPRSEDRPAERRSGASARHGQGGRLLSVALGRQELAADRVQPEDADDLHPGQRESLHDDDRTARHLHGGQGIHGQHQHAQNRRRAPITSAKCRRGTSTPASGSGPTISA